jgi:hypothetical protein
MDDSSETAQSLLGQAIEHTQARCFGEAGQRFLEALERMEAWPDGPQRTEQLGVAADLCFRAGHPDLALMALQDMLESRQHLGNPGRHCADLLTLANSWNGLGRPDSSAAVNEAALAYALDQERYADAASASTNLAILDANAGRLPAALGRLQESLGFLAKESNPDTDAITRLVLLQVVDGILGDPAIESKPDPEVALDASADLFTRLVRYVGPDRWNTAAPAFHRLVDQYVAAHPDLDAEAWKRSTFPLVFKARPT